MSREAMQMALEALESDPISHAGLVNRKQAIAVLRERLAQTVTDYWQEEARRYAQNADYWRSEAEKAQHIIDCPRCGHCCPQQPVQEPVKFKCTVIDDANPNGVPLSQWECQSEQEPFCYHDGRNIVGKEFADHSDVFPLYTAPQPRQWQGLTDEDIKALFLNEDGVRFARYIESRLKDKNA